MWWNRISRGTFFYIFLSLSLLFFLLLVALNSSYSKTVRSVKSGYLSSTLHLARDFSKNFSSMLQQHFGQKDFYTLLANDPKLRSHLQKELGILIGEKVVYVYLLEAKDGTYRFLLDGSKKDHAEFGEPFTPLEPSYFKSQKPTYFFHTKLKSLWLTYLYPFTLGKRHLILVFDFSIDDYANIERSLQRFEKVFMFLILFSLSMSLLLVVFAFFDRKREMEREEALKMLQKLNASLQERVKKAVEEVRQKDMMLFEQAKLSQMGEMVSMIAHQWRQPLNALSAAAIKLSLQASMGRVDPKSVEETSAFIERVAQKMSKTIEEFLQFAKNRGKKERFFLSELVSEVEELVGAQLEHRGIKLDVKIEQDRQIESLKGDIIHILLVLLSNARDALKESERKEIELRIAIENGICHIFVHDTGPGVPRELERRIFEPYFTTKEEGEGVGIGLYMAKRLAKERLGGDLVLERSEYGALFHLWFPIEGSE